jgi:SWI/SNF-related matrix-associated actin-dependent regulator of chromatin subfamily A-like protein 1
MAGFSLRRLKDRTLQLPTKNFSRVQVALAGRQKLMYEDMRNELELWVQSLSGGQVLEEAEAILARLVRLAQLASNPSLLDAGYDEVPAKFAALDALLSAYMETPDQKAGEFTK